MNVARTFKFFDEFKSFNNLKYFDSTRCYLFTNYSVYTLSFNCLLNEANDHLNVDVRNIQFKKEKFKNDDNFTNFVDLFNIDKQLEKLNENILEIVGCQNASNPQCKKFRIYCGIVKDTQFTLFEDDHYSWFKIKSYEEMLDSVNLNDITSDIILLDSKSDMDHTVNLVKTNFRFGSHITSFCSSINYNDVCGYLAVVNEKNVIALWQIITNEQHKLLQVIYCSVEMILDVVMFTLQHHLLLCVSFRNGCMKMFKFEVKKEEMSIVQCCSNLIWDDDDYLVCTNIQFCPLRNLLMASKDSTMILLKLSLDTLVVINAQVIPLDFKLFISSVVCNKNEIYVAVADGCILRMPFLETGNEICGTPEVLSLPWNCKDWTVMGMQQSHNKVFLVFSVFPSKFYCHRVAKLVSLVHYVSIMSFDDVSQMAVEYSGTPFSMQDALCYLKYELSKGTLWPAFLMDYIRDSTKWENTSINKLQIIRNLILINLLYSKTDDSRNEMKNNVKNLEVIIQRKRFIDLFNNENIIKEFNQSQFNNKDLLLLANVKRFFETIKCEPPDFLKDIQLSSPTNEQCLVCNLEIPFECQDKGTCMNNHCFERCSQTMLLCTDIPYRCCFTCNKKFINFERKQQLLNIIQSEECPLCGGVIRMKSGFL